MLPILDRCPGTLEPGYDTYSPRCKAELFGSRTKKVSHILPFPSPNKDPEFGKLFQGNRQRISISGVQEKYSLALVGNQLELVDRKGQYLLKPVPGDLLHREYMPANEHLTMQIARQVFGLETAANAMIFFNDGAPAYLTRRFDYKPDGTKYQVEDFATLLGKTEEREGTNYKYNASYEDIGRMIKRYVPASALAMEKYFRLVLFNYLFSNGDAHLKNFAVIESPDGDYILAPAYDLMCTRLHIDDSDFGLQDGLYEGDTNNPAYLRYGTYTRESFMEFAGKLGIPSNRSARVIDQMMQRIPKVAPLVQRSFLSEPLKEQYLRLMEEKVRRMGLG
ncbi:HipA domain-containing protein [Flavihumibacter rivuli]|uniref:type II toxin-antitoxin system HipA family toxin n=1 Tax=Flavihumibacter rivuli TaxID=2838156 RepID=UPI001BDE2423|nr:HipA domain-containing protein [Flavihumibacter rivuli]ULQ55990.1 HipA domain-containing protein [Flavihumibacter rivuli]